MRIKLNIVLFLLIIIQSELHAQTGSIVSFVASDAVYLKWKGVHKNTPVAYNVYRKELEGSWIKINSTPLQPVFENGKLQAILGYKKSSYLALFGIKNEKLNLNQTAFDSTFAKKGAESFIGALSLLNHEYSVALGETYTDNTIISGKKYQYKIVINENSVETELALSPVLETKTADRVPAAASVTTVSQDAAVTLVWRRDEKLSANGTLIGTNIYMAQDLLGPYEKINFYGAIAVNVKSGNAKSNDTVSYTVPFLENGKTYYFYIKNFNAFGIESAPSITVECSPEKYADLQAPKNIVISLKGKQAHLQWPEKKHCAIYRSTNDSLFKRMYPPQGVYMDAMNEWYDFTVSEGNAYRYYLVSYLENGTTGNPSDTVKWTYTDQTAPKPPAELRAIAEKGKIKLVWKSNTETDLRGYYIERSSDKLYQSRYLLNSVPILATTYTDTLDYRATTRFGYVVYAIDKANHRSEPSKMVFASMPDFDPPASPIITQLKNTDSGVFVNWIPGPEKDIFYYSVFYRAKGTNLWQIEKKLLKSAVTLKLKTDGLYEIAVKVYDSSGNESSLSGIQTLDVKQFNLVPTPTGGSFSMDSTGVEIKWNAPQGFNPDGYIITRVWGDKRLDISEQSRNIFVDRYPPKGKINYEIRSRNKEWKMSKPLIITVQN